MGRLHGGAKLRHLRTLFIAFAIVALLPVASQALIQSQRSQIAITIIINATPNPLGFVGPPAPASEIAVTARLRGAPADVQRRFEAEAQQVHFVPRDSMVVAQTVQHGVKVEASVAPNPNGTLLYADQSAVTVNAEAGIATVVTCAYHVTVHTTVTNWTLKHGLSNDFSDGAGDTFVGGSVANNSYIAAPNPTSTPFVVFSTNGGVWAVLATNGGIKTYCVDLTVNMPITTPQGTYSSNAIYTVYY